jgi:Icc-related predicted phosphoesterase
LRIVCLSDTHNKLSSIAVPDGDILVHAGDFCGHGRLNEVKMFNEEIGKLPHKHKIVIAGNHDWPLERQPQEARELLTNVIYLQDESFEIEGLNFYGSPWQPEFFSWAFNLPRNSAKLAEKWDMIPAGTDIVITHGPPHGILDKTSSGHLAGCELLRKRLEVLKPQAHVFGHIHEGYGTHKQDETLFVNASNLNERYNAVNAPVVIDISPRQLK